MCARGWDSSPRSQRTGTAISAGAARDGGSGREGGVCDGDVARATQQPVGPHRLVCGVRLAMVVIYTVHPRLRAGPSATFEWLAMVPGIASCTLQCAQGIHSLRTIGPSALLHDRRVGRLLPLRSAGTLLSVVPGHPALLADAFAAGYASFLRIVAATSDPRFCLPWLALLCPVVSTHLAALSLARDYNVRVIDPGFLTAELLSLVLIRFCAAACCCCSGDSAGWAIPYVSWALQWKQVLQSHGTSPRVCVHHGGLRASRSSSVRPHSVPSASAIISCARSCCQRYRPCFCWYACFGSTWLPCRPSREPGREGQRRQACIDVELKYIRVHATLRTSSDHSPF